MLSKTIFLVIRKRKVVVLFRIMQSPVVSHLLIIIRQLSSPGGVSQLVRSSGREWLKGALALVTKRIRWIRLSRSAFPLFVDIFSISVRGHSVHTLAIARPSPPPPSLPVPHTNTVTAGQAPQPLALAPAPTLLPAAPPPDAACSLPSAVTKNNPRAHQQPRLGASGSGLELTL